MKKTFLAVLTVLSISSAFAQSLELEIRRKIDRLAVAGDDRVIARLSRVEKDELNNLMDRALVVLRDDGRDGLPDDRRNRPAPGPVMDNRRPTPGPVVGDRGSDRFGRHGRREGLLIAALVENQMIIVRGHGPGDMLLSCMDSVNSARLQRADDMILTVNGGRYVRLTTGGWWTGANQICNTILSQSQNDDYGRAPFIEVVGTVEDTVQVRLEGSRGEILEECAEGLGGLTRADNMTLSINRGQLVTTTTGGWWDGRAGMCGQIAAMIDAQVR